MNGEFQAPGALDPSVLTLSELFATQPRNRRGSLAPGERFPTGMRPSRRLAQGVDLDSIGPYVAGDDLRFMDWRATARTGRAQMKRFVAESHLARMLIVDLRAHMFFATAGHTMAKTAALLAARVAWEALSLHEPLGLIIVPEGDLVEPRRGRAHILRIMDRLVDNHARLRAARQGADNAALAEALETAAGRLHRGDEINLLSDFGGSTDALVVAARLVAGVRTVRAVVIEDAIYTRPVPAGHYPLQAPEEAVRRTAVVSSRMAVRHVEIVAEIRAELRRTLTQAGIRIAEVTGAPYLSEGASH